MAVKTSIEQAEGIYFITFTCQNWSALFEVPKHTITEYNQYLNDKIMKYLSIFLFWFLSVHVAYSQSHEETQKITNEIIAITEKYNQTWETLNMNDVAKFHSDSSFRYYRNMKSSVASNDDFRKKMPLYLKEVKKWTLTVNNYSVQVLSKDVAIISFTGVAELVNMDNKISDEGTGAYTYIWKKVNDQWKLVHIHECTK